MCVVDAARHHRVTGRYTEHRIIELTRPPLVHPFPVRSIQCNGTEPRTPCPRTDTFGIPSLSFATKIREVPILITYSWPILFWRSKVICQLLVIDHGFLLLIF